MLPTHTTKKTQNKQTKTNTKQKKQQQEYSFLNYEYLFKKNIIVKESYKAYFRFFKMFMFGMKVCQLRVFRYQTCNFHDCQTFAKNCFYIAISLNLANKNVKIQHTVLFLLMPYTNTLNQI